MRGAQLGADAAWFHASRSDTAWANAPKAMPSHCNRLLGRALIIYATSRSEIEQKHYALSFFGLVYKTVVAKTITPVTF